MKKLSLLYYIVPALCLMPFFSAPIALACGILLTLFRVEKPYEIKKYTSKILQWSIVLISYIAEGTIENIELVL